MGTTVLRFKQELYPKEAVLKAAYHFIDRFYIHVDVVNDEYEIELITKQVESENCSPLEFENELLAQAVRYQVYIQTHNIREILMARAMSSTITGTNSELGNGPMPDNVDDLDNILTDWFDKNE